ncbi:Mannose-P-dolichol utilization defect 1 protein [Dirofilaria immitis]
MVFNLSTFCSDQVNLNVLKYWKQTAPYKMKFKFDALDFRHCLSRYRQDRIRLDKQLKIPSSWAKTTI